MHTVLLRSVKRYKDYQKLAPGFIQKYFFKLHTTNLLN